MFIANNELIITSDIWIISDTHFFHENIGRYCNRPENWQDLIINNWNDLIAPDEQVLHLGDFALGKKMNFELLTGSLKGKLFLIRGNHDRLSKTYCEAHAVTLLNEPLHVDYNDRVSLFFLTALLFPYLMTSSISTVTYTTCLHPLKAPTWDHGILI